MVRALHQGGERPRLEQAARLARPAASFHPGLQEITQNACQAIRITIIPQTDQGQASSRAVGFSAAQASTSPSSDRAADSATGWAEVRNTVLI